MQPCRRARAPTIRLRAHIVRRLREALWRAHFVEVDTPTFISAPAPERHIDAVPVALRAGMHGPASRRYAQTSPELAMKQVLAAGLPRVFQLATALRDGDYSSAHRPEFRLLEWYRAGADWQAGMADCEWLLREALLAAAQCPQASPFGGIPCEQVPGATAAEGLAKAGRGGGIERLSFAAAAKRFAGLSPQALGSRAALGAALQTAGLHIAADDGYDDLCHRLLVDRIEPGLAQSAAPVFLTHFPAPLASFAALAPDEQSVHGCRVAERFELYAAGLELANGFTELTSRAAYAERFAAEQTERTRLGKPDCGSPAAFLAAADHMPPAVGVAMGLERLLMVALERSDIDDVLTLPYADT